MSEHNRQSDVAIAELVTTLKDFKERYERDRNEDRAKEKDQIEHTTRWRNGFTERLMRLDETIGTINGEMHSILWIKRTFAVLGGGALIAAGKYVFEWVAAHFRA